MQLAKRFTRLTSRRSAVAGGVSAVAAVGLGTVPALCRNRIYPGTQYGEVRLSGLDRTEAEVALRNELTAFKEHALTLTFEDKQWDAGLDDLGFAVNYDAMIDLAMTHGRSDGPLDRYETFVRRESRNQIPLILDELPGKLAAFLGTIAGEIQINATNARLELVDGEVAIIPEADGRAADIAAARDAIHELVQTGERSDLELTSIPTQAAVTQSDLAGAKEDAWNLVSAPIVFTHDDVNYPVEQNSLIQALQIDDHNQASIDPTALRDRLEAIQTATRKNPRNVMLGWDSGPFVVAEDVDGSEVNIAALEDLVVELAHRDDRTAPLPMTAVKAAARADNMDELGINTHLAYGSSSYVGSSAARAENVRVSARNISHKLIAPGETFSFNGLLGPINEDYGYVSGNIIQGSWVESDIGGGVCQVSTTVFRAAANAGFRFSEWNPHSWRLAFYEADGSDPGLDAAIYQADDWSLDLTFKNPLDSWLLLVVTTDSDWVTAHFYGKNPGWNVEMYPATVSEPIQPGPAVERENASLAPGDRRLVQSAQPGYVVSVRRVVTAEDGEVISDGNFVSDYVPQPEAWEVGPN